MSITAFLLYALLALVSVLIIKIKRQLSYWQRHGIACDEPHFMLGNLTDLWVKRTFADIWLYYYAKFKGTGPFAGFYWFQSPSVFVLDKTLIKNILIKDFNKFTDRGFYHNEKDDPLSGQLFLLDGQKWRNMRNKLSPTFTSGKMRYMFPIIMQVGAEFVQVFDEMLKSSSTVEVKELLARFTTDVIGTCAFGIECSSLKDPEAEFRLMGKKALTEFTWGKFGIVFLNSFPNLARKLHMKQTPEHIIKFFMRIVSETVEYREQNQVRRNDFMDMLIDLKNNKMLPSEDGHDMKNLTLGEIAGQAFVFFNAGFETSSTTMGFALYELAQHPAVQERAREEIALVLKQNNGEFTYECMKQMQYLNQIVSETLRLYTVLPVLNRQCIEDYPVPGHPKYVIRKGMRVLIPANAIHRDAEYYENPNDFNPDNFLPDLVRERDVCEWLPFGEGPRNCIGLRFGKMQTCIGLVLLLKNFKFSVCPETQIPLEYDKKAFLVNSASGIYLKVEKV